MKIKENVREFIELNLITLDDDLTVQDDDNIFESGFVDSSVAMQLVTFIEETYGIQIADEDLDLINFSSINRIAQFIDDKIATKV
ncbi:MAG: acyl carrier protein [Nitrospinales bacterium]